MNVPFLKSFLIAVFICYYLCRHAITESELQLAESKVQDLGSLLTKAKQEQDDLLIQHQNELRRERDVSII